MGNKPGAEGKAEKAKGGKKSKPPTPSSPEPDNAQNKKSNAEIQNKEPERKSSKDAAQRAEEPPQPEKQEKNNPSIPDEISLQLATGATFNTKMTVDDFQLLKVVGKGSFGKVMQVRKKDNGKIYAMKVLKKDQLVARKQVAHTQTERKVLEDIDHPFIVSLRFAFQTPSKLYMILDYFTGGELFYHLKNTGRFAEERAKYYAAEITCALECLHKKNIVYRDLKPENVLLDEDGHIRLTDFGLSKESVTGKNLTHTFCGTPEYLAPEVIQGAGYGKAVDWWSLGTLLYEMLTGLPPFYNPNLHVMYEKILRAKLTFPNYLSAEACSLLSQLLERNPKKRLGAGPEDADEVKRHPFFKDLEFEKLQRRELSPPFKPTITEGKLDVGNIDEEFTKETPRDTPVMGSALRIGKQVQFPGFTYIPDSEVGKGAAKDAEGDGEIGGLAKVGAAPAAKGLDPLSSIGEREEEDDEGGQLMAPAKGLDVSDDES